MPNPTPESPAAAGKSAPKGVAKQSPVGPSAMPEIVERYGDLLFDLCHSVLWSQHPAQQTFRAILKRIRAERAQNRYQELERAWVLRVACECLVIAGRFPHRKVTPEEQIRLDSAEKVSTRLKSFDHYFHRLRVDDQILLLLRDKYGLPYPEIASAMGLPVGSLKISRQQALRALEEWLWDQT